MSVSLFSYASSNTFLSRLTLSTGTGWITVTLQVAVFTVSVPSSDFVLHDTSISAVPTFLAVILAFPSSSISSMLTFSGVLLFHSTFLSVVFSGSKMTFSSPLSYCFSVMAVGSSLSSLRAISVIVTVTLHFAVTTFSLPSSDFVLHDTSMVASPTSLAVILTFPLPSSSTLMLFSSTLTLSGASLVHSTFLSVASLGRTLKFSSLVSPFFSAVVVSNLISVTPT